MGGPPGALFKGLLKIVFASQFYRPNFDLKNPQ